MTSANNVRIIDDEPHIRRLLRTTLARASYDVVEAANGREGMALLESAKPDVVLLDLGLPDREGLELVPLIKQRSTAIILVISVREFTEQKVTALDLGADDYLTKPFDTEELLARVRAGLRNRAISQRAAPIVVAGDVRIDLVLRRITRSDEDVHLTPKEYEVVASLAKFPRRVVTHAQLLKQVWPNDYDRHIQYLRVIVRNIRQKLEHDPQQPRLVINELGVGYRLMGDPA